MPAYIIGQSIERAQRRPQRVSPASVARWCLPQARYPSVAENRKVKKVLPGPPGRSVTQGVKRFFVTPITSPGRRGAYELAWVRVNLWPALTNTHFRERGERP